MLLGSEIIEETSNEIILQILISHPEFPVEKAIWRMTILALSANSDTILALENMDENLIKSVIEVCDDVKRLNLYVIRQLKYYLERNLFKELEFKTPKEFLGYRIIINDIKSIIDNSLNLAKNIVTLRRLLDDQLITINEPLDKEMYSQILKFNNKAHAFFEESLKALFKRDYNYADKLISESESYISLENELITMIYTKEIDPNILSIFRLSLDVSRRIFECSRNIAEVTLNRTIEEIEQISRMG